MFNKSTCHILFLPLFLLIPHFLFGSEKHKIEPQLALFSEVDTHIADKDIPMAVYCMEMLESMYPSIKESALRKRYIDLLNRTSMACYDANMFSTSLTFAYKGIDLCESEKYVQPLPELYKTAGNIMSVFEDYDNAMKYYLVSLDKATQMGDEVIVSKALSNLVIINYIVDRPDAAHYYFDQLTSLPKTKSIDSDPTQVYVLYYTKAIMEKLELHYDSAYYYFNLASEFAESHNLPILYVTSCNYGLAEMYEDMGMTDSAKYYYLINEEISSSEQIPEERVAAYRALARIAQKEGDLSKAYFYKDRYLSISDSIFNANELRQVEQNRFEYNEANNRYHINQLNRVSESKSKWIRIILFISVGLLLLLLLILRQKRILDHAYASLYDRNKELLRYESLCFDQAQKIVELNVKLKEGSGEVPPIKESTGSSSFQPNDIQKQLIIESIEKCIRNVEVICNPDFSLEQMSVMTNVNSKYLSQIINETYHQNFRTFISEYRIREAQRMLSNGAEYGNYTIQSIGERVGYRSQSTFISVFKKTTGLTPSQYQQLSLQNS